MTNRVVGKPARADAILAIAALAGLIQVGWPAGAAAQEPPSLSIDRLAIPSPRVAPIADARVRTGTAPKRAAGQDKILLGEASTAGAYPFQVSLIVGDTKKGREGDGHFCGGTLIADEWVLTAAHCVTEPDGSVLVPRAFDIYAGSVNFKGGDRIQVGGVFRHPRYNADFQDNDVALVKLSRAPRRSAAIGKVRLVDAASVAKAEAPGNDAIIIGWGNTESERMSETLQQAKLKLIETKTCNTNLVTRRIIDQLQADVGMFLAYKLRMTDQQINVVARSMLANAGQLVVKGMMCAGVPQPDKGADRVADTCKGDSGGPLLVRGADGAFTQVGIVSWGEGCGLPHVHGVYARVADYLDFIEATVK
jgi:secreted trypsin-like serine protease